MKLHTLLAVTMAPGFVLAQQIAPGDMFAPESRPGSPETEKEVAGIRETVIWQETFGNGIPAGWQNTGSPALAIWEYRGPLTQPDNNSGSRGSCLPPGVDVGAPIDSETREDGFVIFDSNYWDDDEGPCGSFGSGQAAAPHTASLTSPSLDLSLHPFVGVAFHQYAKNFTAQMKVQLSVSGGAFQTVYVSSLVTNAETDRDASVRLNVGAIAGNESDVRIRFLFEGTYYFWMIDDVKVLELDPNDLALSGVTYGDFDPNNPDHPTGYEYMEYSMYPLTMLPVLKFSGRVDNLGGLDQSNSVLSVEMEKEGEPGVLFSGNSEAIAIEAGGFEVLRAGQFTPPSQPGVYLMNFEVASDAIDDQPESNLAFRGLEVHPFAYARDARALEAVYLPADALQNVPYEFGNIFLITEDDQHLASIACALSLGTLTESAVYGKLYEFQFQAGVVTATLVASTQEVQVTGDDLNSPGEEKMLVLPFSSEVALTEGHAYAAMVHAGAGAPSVLSGMSGDAPPFTSWVHFPGSSNWFILSKMPMVRMYFDNGNVLDEPEPFSVRVYPNPAADRILIDAPMQGSYWLFDSYGKMLLSGLKNSESPEELAVQGIADGFYALVFRTKDGRQSTEKLIIRHLR